MTKDQALIHALEIMAPSIEDSVDECRKLLRRRGADEASIERSAAWWREALKQSIVEGFEELQALRDADDRTLH